MNEYNKILKRLLDKILIEKELDPTLILTKVRAKNNIAALQKTYRLLVSSEITFKSFMYILYNIICVRSMKITLSIEWEDGEKSEHSIEVKNRKQAEQ